MLPSEKIAYWKSEIDRLTKEFTIAFGELSEDELNWKPDATTWSIAQNIDHLIVINSSYFKTFSDIAEGRHKEAFWGKFNFIVSILGRFIQRSVQPDRRRKMKTFSIWEPEQSQIGGDILTRFQMHQSDLESWIDRSETALKNRLTISSPANNWIVYRLEKAFQIIIDHEERHCVQAKELLPIMNTDLR